MRQPRATRFPCTSRFLRFDFQNMVITKVSRPVNDGGRILQTIEFSCYSDEASGGTDSGLKVTITNDQTTASAN